MEKKRSVAVTIASLGLVFSLFKLVYCKEPWIGYDFYSPEAAIRAYLDKSSDSVFKNKKANFEISLPRGLNKKWCFLYLKDLKNFSDLNLTGNDVNIVNESWYDREIPEFSWIGIKSFQNPKKISLKKTAKNRLEQDREYYRETFKIINAGRSLKVNNFDAYEIIYDQGYNVLYHIFYISIDNYLVLIELSSCKANYKKDKEDFLKIINTFKKL